MGSSCLRAPLSHAGTGAEKAFGRCESRVLTLEKAFRKRRRGVSSGEKRPNLPFADGSGGEEASRGDEGG